MIAQAPFGNPDSMLSTFDKIFCGIASVAYQHFFFSLVNVPCAVFNTGRPLLPKAIPKGTLTVVILPHAKTYNMEFSPLQVFLLNIALKSQFV